MKKRVILPRTMPRPERMKIVAAQGFNAYSFWNTTEEEQDAMLKVQQQTGLSQQEILDRLSRELPTAVDKYTPDGRLPAPTAG